MGEREVRPDHTADPRAHLIELWDGIKSRIRCESIRKLEHRFELHVPNGIDAFHPGFARGRDGPCPCRVIDERSRSGSTPFAPNKDDGLIVAQVWTIPFPSGASSGRSPARIRASTPPASKATTSPSPPERSRSTRCAMLPIIGCLGNPRACIIAVVDARQPAADMPNPWLNGRDVRTSNVQPPSWGMEAWTNSFTV